MKPNIDHLNRYVSEVEEFIKFYQGLLGYELIDEGKKVNGMNYAILKGFNHELFISEREGFEVKNENFRHIGYSVDNVDELLSEFKKKGYVKEDLQIIIKQFSRQFYIKDPDGFDIDIIQWTDKNGFYEKLNTNNRK
jgi:catechol 2,3-dioxygenase-like lactoylglutathione lyase family enzyme